MSKIDIMTKSGKKGIILATVMLFSGFLLLIPTSAHAEEITVKSIGLDETTIITLTNESVKEVKSFRILARGEF